MIVTILREVIRRAPPCLWLLASLSACTVGPDYARPSVDMPSAYKEGGLQWKQAQPADGTIRGKWWKIYADTTLDGLMEKADANNQDIRSALAAYRQAQAAARAARAGFWPEIDASGSFERSHTTSKTANSASMGLDASWEADLWGSVSRSVEASHATAQADAATLASTRLSVEADLVQDYFQLRVTDATIALQKNTITGYARVLQITRNQLKAGIVTRSDVASAQSQLKSAEASLIDLEVTRAELEHAIAILTGQAPSGFSLPALGSATYPANLPALPAGLPSDLLQRRPDIAAAERAVAAANARIGVATAAFYPALTLDTSGGYSHSRLANLFDAPNRVWSLGAGLAATLFDGGLRRAEKDEAIASYDGSVADYRQTVLGALQEVEDNLSALHLLEQEAKVQAEAVQAALDAQKLAEDQYKAGTTTYSSVIVAQVSAQTAQRTAMTLLGKRYSAHVLLIKALGGGWQPDPARTTID